MIFPLGRFPARANSRVIFRLVKKPRVDIVELYFRETCAGASTSHCTRYMNAPRILSCASLMRLHVQMPLLECYLLSLSLFLPTFLLFFLLLFRFASPFKRPFTAPVISQTYISSFLPPPPLPCSRNLRECFTRINAFYIRVAYLRCVNSS